MNVVSTWCFSHWFTQNPPAWRHTVDMLATMRACAALAVKKFRNFSVYTDQDSQTWLQKILPTTNIILLSDYRADHELDFFYSRPKLFTYLEQKDQFLHIDLDFLIGPQWPLFEKKLDLVGQWWEPVLDHRAAGFYNWHEHVNELEMPQSLQNLNADSPALNTGCLLVQNLEFIQTYATAVNDLVANNVSKIKNVTVPAIEQHVLGMLINKYSIKCSTLISANQPYDPINNQFIHFLGRRWKNRDLPLSQSVMEKTIDSWISPDLEHIANELDQIYCTHHS